MVGLNRCGGGTGLVAPSVSVSFAAPLTSEKPLEALGGGLDAVLDESPSRSMSMGVGGSVGPDMAERLFSRSSGGRLRGCVSELRTVFELDLEADLRGRERRSESLTDLVGDLDKDLLEGEGDEPSRCLLFFRISASEFFLGLKMPGRTIG